MVMGALLFPALASAQPVFVGQRGPLTGSPLDPFAPSRVQIVPPNGGYVVMYRGDAILGWWTQPGLAVVEPGQVYSVAAARGPFLLFQSGIVFRPGLTALVWGNRDQPTIAYQPTYHRGARRVLHRQPRRPQPAHASSPERPQRAKLVPLQTSPALAALLERTAKTAPDAKESIAQRPTRDLLRALMESPRDQSPRPKITAVGAGSAPTPLINPVKRPSRRVLPVKPKLPAQTN
jgi:hypothetical protein